MIERRVRRSRGLGWTMRVDEMGSGATTYVLVHGYGVTSRYLRPTAELLAATGRVLMPTLPGWRGSARPKRALGVPELADVLADWMRAEKLPPAIVVANSFGCQVAAELAARSPDLVRCLVLTGPTVEPKARSFRRMIARLAVDTYREPIRLGGIIALDYSTFGPKNCLAVGRIAIAHRIEDVLPRVSAPVLVVRGERDGLLSREWAEECARLAPAGSFAEIAGSGHAVNYAAGAELAALVRNFATPQPSDA